MGNEVVSVLLRLDIVMTCTAYSATNRLRPPAFREELRVSRDRNHGRQERRGSIRWCTGFLPGIDWCDRVPESSVACICRTNL